MDTTQAPASVPDDTADEVERLSQLVESTDPVETVDAAERLAKVLSDELDRKIDGTSGS